MWLSFNTTIVLVILFPFYEGGVVWKLNLKDSHDSQESTQDIWVYKSSFGCLYWSALCYQSCECLLYTYQNHNCQGCSTEAQKYHEDTPGVNQGSFKKKQKKDEDDGYRNLSSGNTHLNVKTSIYPVTRDEALRGCRREGATLVKIDTQRKVRLINRAFKTKTKYTGFWIGLIKKYGNGSWYWMDGTRLSHFTNWDFLQPNIVYDENIHEICAAIVLRKYASGKWFAAPCNDRKRFICERI